MAKENEEDSGLVRDCTVSRHPGRASDTSHHDGTRSKALQLNLDPVTDQASADSLRWLATHS